MDISEESEATIDGLTLAEYRRRRAAWLAEHETQQVRDYWDRITRFPAGSPD